MNALKLFRRIVVTGLTGIVLTLICSWGKPVLAQTYDTQSLTNYVNNVALNSTTKKLIVCIHGWNAGFGSPGLMGPEWTTLVPALSQQLPNSDWNLALYDWHTDADTGSRLQKYRLTAKGCALLATSRKEGV